MERIAEGDLGARPPDDIPLLKPRGLHQMMSKLPTGFLIGFKDCESCSNLTDLNTFSGSGSTA